MHEISLSCSVARFGAKRRTYVEDVDASLEIDALAAALAFAAAALSYTAEVTLQLANSAQVLFRMQTLFDVSGSIIRSMSVNVDIIC